jgi:hypothetical protein
LWLLGLSGVAVVAFGTTRVHGLDPLKLLDGVGYWIIGLLSVCWVLAGHAWLRAKGRDVWRLLGWWGLAGSLGVWGFLATREPAEFKLLMDEPLLADTALGMHVRRSVTMPTYVCENAGVRSYLGQIVDKRPLLFPFVLSLVHDATGYRVENAFWLNRGLLLVLILLGWVCGRKLDPDYGGPLMLLWFCGWPLVAQNASGGGFDLLNLVLVLAVVLAGTAYLEERNATSEALLLATCLLLANTRYESVLFLAVFALLWLIGAVRRRSVSVSWFAVFSPFFLLPYLWQRGVMAEHAARWESDLRTFKTDHIFGADFVAENLRRAWHFLVVPGRDLAGSAYLGALGLAALVVFAVLLVGRWRSKPADLPRSWPALASVLAIVGVIFGVLMCYFWGQLDDPMVSRLALPLVAMMGLSLCALRPIVLFSRPLRWVLLGSLGLWTLAYAVPSMNEHRYSRENMHMRIFLWAQDIVALQNSRRPLVISSEERVWTAYRTFSLLPDSACRILPQIEYQLREGSIDAVFVIQGFAGERDSLGSRPLPGNRMPPEVGLEPLAERSFYPYNLVRISRVTAIDLTRATASPAAGTEASSGVFIQLSPEQMAEVRSLLP